MINTINLSPKAMLLTNEPLSNITSFRIGGPAEYLLLPATVEDIVNALDWARSEKLPWRVIGSGTNVLVPDAGLPGLTIKLWHHFDRIDLEGNLLSAQAGADMLSVAKKSAEFSLAGFEWAAGIPGTVGGAVYMNAGVKDLEVRNNLLNATVISSDGDLLEMKNEDLQFGYRSSILQKTGGVVLQATFKLPNGQQNEIYGEINDHLNERRTKQPIDLPNCGSVFRNPEGDFAARLIQESGLKGHRIGGAEFSQQHANFIVNIAGGTANDVLALVDLAKDTVMKRFGIELKLEMRELK